MSQLGAGVPTLGPLIPPWQVGAGVGALLTGRAGGVSRGAYGSADGSGGLNLGTHCGDDPAAVARNRALLGRWLPGTPVWLDQVHGTDVHEVDAPPAPDALPVRADAAVTAVPGVVLAVLTADCLPVLLADARAQVVGVAHAGWRGLAAGVLEATVARMVQCGAHAPGLCAHLGPAIGPTAFEVGEDVLAAFTATAAPDEAAVRRCFAPAQVAGKWFADLYGLARLRLAALGVRAISGGERCTFGEPEHFFSYRRERDTGRQGAFVWIVGAGDGRGAPREAQVHKR